MPIEIEVITSPPVTAELYNVLPPIVIGDALPWQFIDSSTQLSRNIAYAVDALTIALLPLPQSAQTGDRVVVYAVSGVFRIVQAVGQQCKINDDLTTQGEAGAIVSLHDGDLIELTYLPPLWVMSRIFGNLLVV